VPTQAQVCDPSHMSDAQLSASFDRIERQLVEAIQIVKEWRSRQDAQRSLAKSGGGDDA
jgi:hypothetical protein